MNTPVRTTLTPVRRRLLQLGVGLAMAAASVFPAALPAQAAGSIDLCVSVGKTAGFTGDRLVTAVAVGMAESRCDPLARYVNTSGSIDRGLWQINNYWHSEVSDSCAYDAQCNASAAYRISSSGTDWTPWSTYNSGSYQQYIDDAQAAIARANGSIRDVNRDGRSDLVAIHDSGALYRYTGNGDGSLNPGVSLGTGWGNFRLTSLADVNGDGVADFVGVHSNGSLYRYLGRGDGTFLSGAVIWSGGWGNFRMMTSADLNNDGRADLLAMHNDGSLYRYVGRSDGTFASWGGKVGGGWGAFRLVTSGDVNGDGRADLLAVGTDGSLYRWLGKGDGTFASAVNIWSGGWGNFRLINSADYNNDGRTDLFAVHNDGSLYRYTGRSDGTLTTWGGKVGGGWSVFATINN